MEPASGTDAVSAPASSEPPDVRVMSTPRGKVTECDELPSETVTANSSARVIEGVLDVAAPKGTEKIPFAIAAPRSPGGILRLMTYENSETDPDTPIE